jgi:polyisoprenoid-binding protein YceI
MLATLVFATGTSAFAEQWALDPDHSAVVFSISHLNTSNQHGRFNEIEGSVTTGDDASFRFSVQAASIDTNNTKRDDHLRGPDFFNAKQFPTISLASTVATVNDASYVLTGDLTLHGVTNPITVQMNKIGEGDGLWGNHRVGFETTVTIKRSDFGMNNMLEMVGDDVTLTVSYEAIRQ